ncbi:MAG: septal ring lytic transglycosylase RlpA family protein [Methylococcaceae bacterium]|nr:septal ring lytic transglycosylase RlpA family protein [Methylococcaceae bacterium]
MNKIIPATSIFILCSCSTEQIKTTDISTPVSMTTTVSKPTYAPKRYLADHPTLGRAVQFRHHTVLNVKKFEDDAANDESVNETHDDSGTQDNFIPRIARYLKQGIASWYGPGFHGKKTANGEIFDMYALTAAHNTLPIPSYAKVTNLENQRSVIVRINDRGPFVGNRLLDLSYAAAKKLDLQEGGVGKVEIKSISSSQALPQLQKSSEKNESNVYLQVGSFGSEKKALKLKNKISSHHLPQPKIRASKYKTATLYKVQMGPIDSSDGADKLYQQLAKIGITDTQIVTESETKQN